VNYAAFTHAGLTTRYRKEKLLKKIVILKLGKLFSHTSGFVPGRQNR